MNRSPFIAISFAGALALAASPAFAQHHRGGGEERHESAAAPRGEQRAERPAPQRQEQAQPRQEQARPQAQPRQQQRVEQARPREAQRAVPRENYRNDDRRGVGRDYRAVPRQEYRGSYSAPRYYNGGSRYTGRYYGPRYVGPRFSIAPRRFYRPYYVFRPRFSVGFGIWAGFPVTYYDPFYYPYDYYPYASGAPGVYPVPPQGSVNVQPYAQPNQANMGGLSFDITPNTAEIYVDGEYFGEVGQFTPSAQPLGLPAGRHHVELREPGYDVMSFDVDIIAGQVIPYQGQLQQ
jgi:hypothetical protein